MKIEMGIEVVLFIVHSSQVVRHDDMHWGMMGR